MAFDGDGDRVGAMTAGGELLWGDRMLALFAGDLLAKKRGAVVFDVKCSLTLIEEIERSGGKPVMWKTGYPLIQEKMREEGAELAGEMSGHMYFADRYFGFDDGLYAGCRLVELVSNADESLDTMVSSLPKYPSTPEMRLHCADSEKRKVMARVLPFITERHNAVTVDGVRFIIDGAWGLIRVSNTEPAIVVRFEGQTPSRLNEAVAVALDALKGSPVDVAPLEGISQ